MKETLTYQPNKQKLLEYGFIIIDNKYQYSTLSINKDFILTITIQDCNISVDIFDFNTKEKFIPFYVSNMSGMFLSNLRIEVDQIVKEIIEQCCEKEIFQEDKTKQIIKYVKTKYQDELEYLWKKFPNNAIVRNKKTRKWYLVLLTVEKKKLGIQELGLTEIIDLRIPPDEKETQINNVSIFPGYHMNKKHWISIRLDSSISLNTVYKLIDHSYELSNKK